MIKKDFILSILLSCGTWICMQLATSEDLRNLVIPNERCLEGVCVCVCVCV